MKNKLLIVLFTVWLGGMFFSSVLIPDQTISKEENLHSCLLLLGKRL